MTQDNSDQRAFWSGPSGTSWIAFEEAQDALLESVARHVISKAAVQPGERVIDIGCGTGALSEMASVAVGTSGSVLATDISEPLLARAQIRLMAFPQAATRLGDAATIEWHGAECDVALSRFGVMFFADPPAAFANIVKALRPKGRLVFAAWGPAAVNPYWSIGSSVAASHLGTLPQARPNAAGPMGLSDLDYALSVPTLAGLADVGVTPTELLLTYPKPAAALADLMTKLGAAGRYINAHQASSTQIAAIRNEIADRLLSFERADETVALPALINVITATKS